MANILSYGILGSKYRITSDTWHEDAFTVHNFNGIDVKFVKSSEGLYYHDMRWAKHGIPKHILESIKRQPVSTTTSKGSNVIMLNTVKDNESGYTKKELRHAKLAKRLYALLGRPSYRAFANIVKWRMLKNCPISFSDVCNAWEIYGPDLGATRGKTTRQKPLVINDKDIVKVPQEILFKLQDITLCVDVMFMDKLVMFTTYSRRIAFTTIDVIKSQNLSTLYEAIKKVLALYLLSAGVTVWE